MSITKFNIPTYKEPKDLWQPDKLVKSPAEMEAETHSNAMAESRFNRFLKFLVVYLAFAIAITWLWFIAGLVREFLKLDPYNTKVIIALLTTSMATVVGLPAIALRGTFKVLQEENKAMELKNKLNNQ